ncbi:ferrochelatase [Thalassoglobus sp. JC818]|uniref:ferrochelatase n=1 Tax=Thalassoglobus sp. JC818 TaxID=3232136 RepID=UPI00345A8C23
MSEYNYDAVLFVAFGGPESRDDVMPFLENVLRGRNVPRERMLEVAEHYYHFDGVSPINQQMRELIDAVTEDLASQGVEIPIYWGNRNWHPMLTETMQKMADDGIQNAIAFVASAYSSYSGCRQYRENVYASQDEVGESAPDVDKIRTFYNHPGFISANVARIEDAIAQLPERSRGEFHVAFTAHSIPNSMSDNCDYVQQLSETCRLIADSIGIPQDRWKLVYQSRSGRPEDPWLEPDILDHIDQLNQQGVGGLIIAPVGFLSDHMEVLFDLDEEAALKCKELGVPMSRAASVGTHPDFVRCVSKLIMERLLLNVEKEAIGQYGPNWDVCPQDCCPAPVRRRRPSSSS